MIAHHKCRLLLLALLAVVSLPPAQRVAAQVFTTLYSFTNGNDGANPYGVPYGVVLSGSTLYGTATYAGASGSGTVFAVNINGSGFTNLHSFSAFDPFIGTNSDGASPNGLILSGGTLYGTAAYGGTSGSGTVFALSTNGSGFTNLHNFTATDSGTGTNSDGASPFVGLILSGSTLYGTAAYGGLSGNGAVFALNYNGSGFTNLYSFSALDTTTGSTNGDGASPQAALTLSGNTLYGSAAYGGSSGNGTVFALNTNGGSFTNLHNFSATLSMPGANADGATPGGLVLSGNTLYVTSSSGGASGTGTLLALNTSTLAFTNLHSFSATNVSSGTNSDGAGPFTGLILSRDTLYGTAPYGGTAGNGTVFAINTNGGGFANLHNFSATNAITGSNSDGAFPQAGLILSGDTLYGTTYDGGSSGYGAVFSLSFPPPPLTIALSGTNVILTWPTNVAGFSYSGFTLQSARSLVPTPAWNSVFPSPVVVNSRYTVTNPISGPRQFYRLSLAPLLAIVLSGNQVILTWPANATGFTLQSSTNLGPSLAWTNVSPAPVAVNSRFTVTNSISGTTRFYRLSQ